MSILFNLDLNRIKRVSVKFTIESHKSLVVGRLLDYNNICIELPYTCWRYLHYEQIVSCEFLRTSEVVEHVGKSL